VLLAAQFAWAVTAHCLLASHGVCPAVLQPREQPAQMRVRDLSGNSTLNRFGVSYDPSCSCNARLFSSCRVARSDVETAA
jgi:hypothetical protein